MSTGSTSDAASTKIVDLSKKLRELTAELESERNKNRLSARRIQELANQVGFFLILKFLSYNF